MRHKLTFIAAQAKTHALRRLCAVLGVSRSWYYRWRDRHPRRAAKEQAEQVLSQEIKSIFDEHRSCYGSPRIHAVLKRRGWQVSRRRVAKIMKTNKITPLRRKRRLPKTTDSRHHHQTAPNLLKQQFQATALNHAWLMDLTYVATDEGWLYLAAVKDMATCEIVGWSMSERLKSTICEDALMMAIHLQQPPQGLIAHSDRGIQYACQSYRQILNRHGLIQSMSHRGNCLDNAPMESFFGSLKTELVHKSHFRTRAEAKRTLFDYIEIFYNRQRLHSSLGYRTPTEAKADMINKMAA